MYRKLLPEKNHSSLLKQITNILIKFCTFETFKIKHKNRKQLYYQLQIDYLKKGGSFSL